MNANALPDDILHVIFSKLNGISVMHSRQVCHRWQEAVDSLSDKDWEKICSNEWMYEDYVAGRSKYGLSWRDTYKAINSWKRIGSFEMSTQELSDGVEHFKVLPNGIVACLQNNRNKLRFGCSDTIVYYNTETFQQCGKEEFNFAFSATWFEENEHFKVMIKHNGEICVVVNETKQQFIVGFVDSIYESVFGGIDQLSVIGKEIYFKNSKDEVIYVSKLINENGMPTVKTEPLEAFIKNHESFEEYIIACTIKEGNVNILSDEGNKANIYIHENADFGWVAQPTYDQPDIFIELQNFGFDWKSPAIYRWLRHCTNLCHKPVFYSHGNVYLTTRSNGRTLCIHYCPYYIYGPDHLIKVFKGNPHRRISVKELIPENIALENRINNVVIQLDIIETTTSHKVLVLVGNVLFVLEFTPHVENRSLTSSQSVKKTASKKTTAKCQTAAKKSLQTAVETSKTGKKTSVRTARKKIGYTAKKKSVQTKRKTMNRSRTLPQKHTYATRSSTK